MSENLGASDLVGDLPSVDFNGRKLKLRAPTPDTLARIEERIMDSAYAEAESLADRAKTPSQQRRAEEALKRLDAKFLDRAEHKVGKAAWNEAFEGPRGVILITWSLFSEADEKITESEVARWVVDNQRQFARLMEAAVGPFARALAAKTGAKKDGLGAAIAKAQAKMAVVIEGMETEPEATSG
jgi:hypothetical protein